MCNADRLKNMSKDVYLIQIMDTLKPIIKQDMSVGMERPLNEYLDRGIEELKRRYQVAHKWTRFKAWTLDSRNEVMSIWLEMKPDLIAAIEDYIKDRRSRKMTKEIKSASAYAMIKAAMREADLRFQYCGQTYRARVSVLVTPKSALTLYISYKKINEQLPKVMESLKLIKKGMEVLGDNTSLSKAYNTGQWE